MVGLKENVIIGKLIPAGTGLSRYKDVSVRAEVLPEERRRFEAIEQCRRDAEAARKAAEPVVEETDDAENNDEAMAEDVVEAENEAVAEETEEVDSFAAALIEALSADLGDEAEDDFAEDEDDDEEFDFADLGDDFFEIECPECGEDLVIDESIFDVGEIACPNCGNKFALDLVDEEEEDED